MKISFLCPSGHRLSAADSLSGKTVRCARCKQLVCVPEPREGVATDQASAAGDTTSADAVEVANVDPAEVDQVAEVDRVPPEPNAGDAVIAQTHVAQTHVAQTPVADATAERITLIVADLFETPSQSRPSPQAPPPPPPLPLPLSAEQELPLLAEQDPSQPSAQPQAIELPPPRESRGPLPGQPIQVPRGSRLLWPNVYQPDAAKVAAVRWLALILTGVVLFSVSPLLFSGRWNLETAPGWARLVFLVAAWQAVYIAWMLAAPDWASVWVVMLVFAVVASLYGMAAAMVLATPLDQPMFLGLGEIRQAAKGWCGSVLLAMSLATYLCGRASAKWRRVFELDMAGRRKSFR